MTFGRDLWAITVAASRKGKDGLRRAEDAVVAALLHDVLDDTRVKPAHMLAEFGRRVTDIVQQVSQLSNTNQLLRRKIRTYVRS